MKKYLLFAGLLTVFSAQLAFAYPRFSENNQKEIDKPEIIQSYYGELKGSPDQYVIKSNENFDLSVQLALPDLPNINKNIVVWVRKHDSLSPGFVIDGQFLKWKSTTNPFLDSKFLEGPARILNDTDAGTYDITVFNAGNQGKYILKIGNKKSNIVTESTRTLISLPKIKKYFGEPALTAFFNLSGACFLLIIYVALMIGFICYKVKRRHDDAKKL